MAPAESAEAVSAAADSVGVAEPDSEWPERSSSVDTPSVHSAVKLELELEQASPKVLLEPVTKFTAAH